MGSLFAKFAYACCFIIVFSFALLSATMPPAPPEWYTEKLHVPIPENYSRAVPPQAAKLHEDLPDRVLNKRLADTDNLLLILVQFPDNAADEIAHPASAYEDMMFSTGVVPTGSLVEYYQEVSYGAFTPAGTVSVWITAPHPYSYYTDGDYGMGGYPNNSQGLLEDCVDILDPFLDFSQFDNDNDGFAEGIFLVHAGPGAEETGSVDDIWSHAWYHDYETEDGVWTGRYSTEPEEFMDGSMIAIGVFCHEYGHVLGLPDLYDTDGSSEGVGVYCLMAGGSWGALPGDPWTPTHMCAEMKYQLGWMTPIEVTGSLSAELIPPAETNAVCYRITNPSNPTEYFLIENRSKIGFDSHFRGNGGLAIWHVDYDGWQSNEAHRYVTLEQADGNGDLERDHGTGNRHERTNRGDAGDLYPFVEGTNDYFSFSSHPSSYSYDGMTAFLTLDNIAFSGDDISVDIIANSTAPIFRFDSYFVNDAISQVIENGKPDNGETVGLSITLAIDGADVSSLQGILYSDDARVDIIKNSSTYPSGDHITFVDNYSDPFRVEILSAATDSAVTFVLSLLADGQPYELDFTMNINRQNVLVVLDNNGSHWSDNIVEALHNIGSYSFDVWSVEENGSPGYNDMIAYNAVLWTTGSYFGTRTSSPDYEYCLSANELNSLTRYLDTHGRLGLFSQDYLYDVGLNSFATDYLRVSSYTEDQGSDSIVSSSGYYSGIGHTAEWSMYDYTDFVVPTGLAATAIEDKATMNGVGIQYPSTEPYIDWYAATFTPFAIERLDPASLEALLSDWLDWIMLNPGTDVPIPLYPIDGDSLTGNPMTYRWTPVDGALSYSVLLLTDSIISVGTIIDEFQTTSTTLNLGNILPEGDYYWTVKAIGSIDTSATSAIEPFTFYMNYLCGDANNDWGVAIGDVVFIVNYIFKGGPPPPIPAAADADCGGSVNIGDAVYLINYIFRGGPAPCANCTNDI
ncbi:MAG: M6 family metalloprotease domain-containing protein [Candidatus Zixiibacteriota bacterium]